MSVSRSLTNAEIRRKTNKPIMEKKRRERINRCLEELKNIVLRAVNEESRPNKLEKADILEMTVRYLRTIRHLPHIEIQKDAILPEQAGFQRVGNSEHPRPLLKHEFVGYPQEKRDCRFNPYQRPPYPMTNPIQMPAAFNNRSQFVAPMTSRIPAMPVAIPGKFSPIPMSPISSVSSKSPSPVTVNSDESKLACGGNRPSDQSKSRACCQALPAQGSQSRRSEPKPTAISSAETSKSWSTNGSSLEFTSESFSLCNKSTGFIWRPWGIAS